MEGRGMEAALPTSSGKHQMPETVLEGARPAQQKGNT